MPHISSTSPIVASTVVVMGWSTMPASDRFTRSTLLACSSADMLRCRMPSPPWRAIAMAMRASVTVSIAELSSGTRSEMRRLTWVVVSTSLGMTSDSFGCSSTSSNVRPNGANGAGTPEGVRSSNDI